VLVTSKPTQLRGQREWFGIPPADLIVFLHQQRPLRKVPALTLIHDTTPLRFNRNRVDAWSKAAFLRRVGRISDGVISVSDHSSRSIERELGVPPERITRVRLPADSEVARRVLALRAATPYEDVALYVGLFLAHKNLPRLIEAFGRTAFRKRGGKLLLLGGKEAAGPLRDALDGDQRGYVTIRSECSQAELERLYATSRFLVQPSLEEGFGLPVQEALACGLPVCVSRGGALPEVTLGFATHFDPTSPEAMAAAIDQAAEQAVDVGRDDGHSLSAAFLARTPTIDELTRQLTDLVETRLLVLGRASPRKRGTP